VNVTTAFGSDGFNLFKSDGCRGEKDTRKEVNIDKKLADSFREYLRLKAELRANTQTVLNNLA
jgi:hypothetical protein